MIWPDAIPFYVIKGLIFYLSHPEGVQAGQSAWAADWGTVALVVVVALWALYQFHTVTTQPLFRPNLMLKSKFQEKTEGRIVWIKGDPNGFVYGYWKIWASLYRKFPFWMGMDFQIGMMLFIFGLLRIIQSVHFDLSGQNLIPQWGPEVGIMGRLAFYASLPLIFGYLITARSDFHKLKGYDPYHIALGPPIKSPQKIIYFRQTGRHLEQLIRTAQLWYDEKKDPVTETFGRRIIEAANISYVPQVKGDIFVLHDKNDAPQMMEDWMGVSMLVSEDIKGSQKMSVVASASDPDLIKRQQERSTFALNLDWEKIMLEVAQADGTISPREQDLLDKYFKGAHSTVQPQIHPNQKKLESK